MFDKYKLFDIDTFKFALKSCFSVILGYLPTGFAFGLMLTSVGYNFFLAVLMSLIMFAGAGQYLAVDLLASNSGFFQIAILTFLINSKHLFYGLSLLNDYNEAGKFKPYLIFSLTDETYALLTGIKTPEHIDRTKFCIYASFINHMAWLFASFLGAIVGAFFNFDTKGMDFAMTALFIVILIGQLKTYKTKIPFIIGVLSSLLALLLFGKGNMLLVGSVLSGILLILFRKKVEKDDALQ